MDLTSILLTADSERLSRAEEGIETRSFSIRLIRNDRAEVSGYVIHDANEYGVKITPTATFCSCKDAMYRGRSCKHILALALTVTYPEAILRTAPSYASEPVSPLPPPNLTLGRVRRERDFAA